MAPFLLLPPAIAQVDDGLFASVDQSGNVCREGQGVVFTLLGDATACSWRSEPSATIETGAEPVRATLICPNPEVAESIVVEVACDAASGGTYRATAQAVSILAAAPADGPAATACANVPRTMGRTWLSLVVAIIIFRRGRA